MVTEEERILSRINRKVRFRYPEPEPERRGTLKDRCVVSSTDEGHPAYWDIIDLIQMQWPHKENWIRFGYYRMSVKGRLVFAGQLSLSEPIEQMTALFVKAAKEKPWFRKFLHDVVEAVGLPPQEEA